MIRRLRDWRKASLQFPSPPPFTRTVPLAPPLFSEWVFTCSSRNKSGVLQTNIAYKIQNKTQNARQEICRFSVSWRKVLLQWTFWPILHTHWMGISKQQRASFPLAFKDIFLQIFHTNRVRGLATWKNQRIKKGRQLGVQMYLKQT